MKYSTKVSDAVHILSFIALNAKESLTSQAIAESVKTNPAFVRQMMSSLRNAGLLTSVKGHAKPALSRDAKNGWKSRDSDQRRKMPGPPRLSFRLAESYNESNSNYRILCISVCFKAGCLTCGN